MKKWFVLMTMSGLFLAATTSRADLIVPPKTPKEATPSKGQTQEKDPLQEVMLNGKLSWERQKLANGAEKNGRLLLTENTGEVIALGVAGQIKAAKTGEAIDADKYIGKQVNVTVMARRSHSGKPAISVEQIISIKEAAKPTGP